MRRMGLQTAVDDLSQNSSRVSNSDQYLHHLRARLRTLPQMRQFAIANAPCRWGFHCYRKEQLATYQLSQDLLLGRNGPSVIVWGNGGFGPTSSGHASAPNKRLQRLLSKYTEALQRISLIAAQCMLSRSSV